MNVDKSLRLSLDVNKLSLLKQILKLSDKEYETMLNLAGKQRKTVAPDLVEYIMGRDYVSSALRAARDHDAGEEEWKCFVEKLKNKGEQ